MTANALPENNDFIFVIFRGKSAKILRILILSPLLLIDNNKEKVCLKKSLCNSVETL